MDGRASIETLGQAYSAGWRVHMRCNVGKQMGLKRILADFHHPRP